MKANWDHKCNSKEMDEKNLPISAVPNRIGSDNSKHFSSVVEVSEYRNSPASHQRMYS